MNVTNDQTLQLLAKSLDALSARQAAISNNIANVETPNYKAIDVAFENSLRKAIRQNESLALTRTDPKHMDRNGNTAQQLQKLEPQPYTRTQTSMRKDGNNVDVETEMVQLAETAMRYEALTVLASKKLALMRLVAQESR